MALTWGGGATFPENTLFPKKVAPPFASLQLFFNRHPQNFLEKKKSKKIKKKIQVREIIRTITIVRCTIFGNGENAYKVRIFRTSRHICLRDGAETI